MSTMEAIKKLQRLGKTSSLDTPIGGTDDDPMYIDTPDTRPDPLALALDHEQREQIGAALDGLTPRERVVVTLTFGLDNASPLQLDEIGELFGVTRQRTHQVQRVALARLAQSLVAGLDLDERSIVPALARSRRKR